MAPDLAERLDVVFKANRLLGATDKSEIAEALALAFLAAKVVMRRHGVPIEEVVDMVQKIKAT